LIAGIVGDLFDHLESWSASWWFLWVIFGIAFLDSVIPVVPSETAVILGGVAAGSGDQVLPLVILSGALGAILGDNAAYQLGLSAQGLVRRTLFRGEKGDKRLDWASRQLRTRGGMLLVTARFIPGGRTAVTVSSGVTAQPRLRFCLFDAVACLIWATYAAVLGFVGGAAFEDNHTVAFIVAFAAALSVSGVIELIRYLRHRNTKADSVPA